MSIRPPQNLQTQLQTNTGASVLEAEIFAEHAASLGHHGKLVEKAMAALETGEDSNTEEHDKLLDAAADAVYNYFVIREAVGINNHDHRLSSIKLPRLSSPVWEGNRRSWN